MRIPAAFCGNFGLKPSFGRVPAHPLSPFGTVSHLGPHTMSVADAALMMNVLKRPDPRDWTSLPPDDSDYLAGLDAGIDGVRVLFSPALGYAKVHPEVAAAVAAGAKQLEALGAKVEEGDPGFDDPLPITIGLWFTGAWTLWNTLTPAQQEVTDPDFAAEARLGSELSNLDVQRLVLRRGELGSRMRQLMQHYDLIVTPSVAVPAFEARPAGHTPMSAEAMLGWTPFSYPFNLTQQPACTIPCGLTSDGLPIGMQLVGPMFNDALVLRGCSRLRDGAAHPSACDRLTVRSRLPEDLDLGVVGIPAPERDVVLVGSEVFDVADPHARGRKGGMARDDLVGVGTVEPDVEALGQCSVGIRRHQREEEPLVVLHEEAAVGLECGLEAEVLHVEVAARHCVADPKVQVVQVHGAILADVTRRLGRASCCPSP